MPAVPPSSRSRARGVSLRVVILAAVSVAVLLMGAGGVASSIALRDQGARSYHAVHKTADVYQGVVAVHDALWQVRSQSLVLAAAGPEELAAQWASQQARLDELDQQLDTFAGQYRDSLGAPLQGLAQVKANLAALSDAQASAFDPSSGGTGAGATTQAQDQRLEELSGAVGALTDEVESRLEEVALADQADGRVAVTVVIALLIVGTGLSLWVARWLSRRIVGAAVEVRHALEALAQGDLTVEARVKSRDEIGEMALALTVAQGALRGTMGEVVESARAVAAASTQLASANAQVASNAKGAATEAYGLATAADGVEGSVHEIAAGAQQLGASIKEISENANDAARIAAEASAVTRSTTERVSRLGVSSQEIGDVVKVITSIAEQTNLLALNATIEAARAGDAGKGFAVVASEVKELARETAQATDEVSRRIAAIQGDAGGAVEAIDQIAEIVTRINDLQSTIAAAVEEQTATTGEMSRGIGEAAASSSGIARGLSTIAHEAKASHDLTAQMESSVSELARRAAALQARVESFRF